MGSYRVGRPRLDEAEILVKLVSHFVNMIQAVAQQTASVDEVMN